MYPIYICFRKSKSSIEFRIWIPSTPSTNQSIKIMCVRGKVQYKYSLQIPNIARGDNWRCGKDLENS